MPWPEWNHEGRPHNRYEARVLGDMLAGDWPETAHPQDRPRYFLYCETCGTMFLTPFRVRICRECWNIGRRPQ